MSVDAYVGELKREDFVTNDAELIDDIKDEIQMMVEDEDEG